MNKKSFALLALIWGACSVRASGEVGRRTILIVQRYLPGTLNNCFLNGCLVIQPFLYVKIWNHPIVMVVQVTRLYLSFISVYFDL